MAVKSSCPACGSPLQPDGRCPDCASGSVGRLAVLRGDMGMLALLVLVLVLFSMFTSSIVGRYHGKLRALGEQWAREADQALKEGRAAEAVTDYQTALRYDGDVLGYRYGLVNALLAAKRTEQARSYLLNMWERQPGDGLVNLQLARIAAARHDVTAATRYYHNAIYGAWDEAGTQHRLSARLELANFLIDSGDKRRAAAEITSLSASAPMTPELTKTLCTMFARADDYDAALENCEAGLKTAPNDPVLLAQAANSSFQLGQYARARKDLERETKLGYQDPNAQNVGLAALILDHDPLDTSAPYRERVQRLLADLQQTSTRVQSCLTTNNDPALTEQMVDLDAAQSKTSMRAIMRDPDLLASSASLVFSAQETAARVCGEPTGVDKAILLIGRRHKGGAQ